MRRCWSDLGAAAVLALLVGYLGVACWLPGTDAWASAAAPPKGGKSVAAASVNRVRFYPRSGFASRMVGGRFTGSNTSETTDFVVLATITRNPAENAWTELTFPNQTVYRYIKYEAPNGGWGNVAEVEFYSGNTRLRGRNFGTAGSVGNGGNDFTKALDEDTRTFFDAPTAGGAYVGMDLGAENQVAAPTFSPEPWTYRTARKVVLRTPTRGASIRYTTDGSRPAETRGTLYKGPISVTKDTTIAAVAYKKGMAQSEVALGTFTIGAPPPVRAGQRTYHLGNSLTDTINGWLAPVAQSAGYRHDYLRSTIPGAPTDWNWDHPGNANGEPDYRVVFAAKAPIDHLFTQPFAGHDRSIENEAEYSGRFFRLAREKSPNVQHWLYAQWPDKKFGDNWAKGKGSASGLGLTPATTWEQAARNHLAYVEAVRQRMDEQNEGKGILVVPGGSALARLKQEIEAGRVPGIKDFFAEHFSDDLHLSAKGAYLIALVHYACVYKRNPASVTFAGTGLTAEQAAIYQRIAWDTARNYPWSGVAR